MSWMESLGKNLIKNVEFTIGDNKTIGVIVDGNLKVEHYYKNKIIIEKPDRIEVNVINTISSPNKDIRHMSPIPKKNV